MITLVGTSHRSAPLDVRERLAIPEERLPSVLPALSARFGAAAVLGTCNRLEIYLAGAHERAAVLDALAETADLDRALLERHFEHRRDIEAVRHLHAVAAGIDSMVLGESEILGQVRAAFSAYVAAGSEDAVLSRLFHSAIRTGRRARSETEIGRHSLSLSSIAAQQARALHPRIADATVLVLGAGDAGRAAAEALVERGVARTLVTSRTAAHAEALARALSGEARPFEALADALAESDVVLAAAGARDYLVAKSDVERAQARRGGRPLVVIDIGVPRAFDPSAREVPGVEYRDLDDLQAVAAANSRARQAEVAQVQALVDRETDRFLVWWEQLRVAPTIAALTERIERLRQAELAKSLRLLGAADATPDALQDIEQRLDALTRALVKQILHDPIATLRERGDRDVYVDAVRALFRLDEARLDGPRLDDASTPEGEPPGAAGERAEEAALASPDR